MGAPTVVQDALVLSEASVRSDPIGHETRLDNDFVVDIFVCAGDHVQTGRVAAEVPKDTNINTDGSDIQDICSGFPGLVGFRAESSYPIASKSVEASLAHEHAACALCLGDGFVQKQTGLGGRARYVDDLRDSHVSMKASSDPVLDLGQGGTSHHRTYQHERAHLVISRLCGIDDGGPAHQFVVHRPGVPHGQLYPALPPSSRQSSSVKSCANHQFMARSTSVLTVAFPMKSLGALSVSDAL